MYKLFKNSCGQDGIIKTNDDGSITSFLCVDDNTDYQAYLKWVEEGNTPLPADEVQA